MSRAALRIGLARRRVLQDTPPAAAALAGPGAAPGNQTQCRSRPPVPRAALAQRGRCRALDRHLGGASAGGTGGAAIMMMITSHAHHDTTATPTVAEPRSRRAAGAGSESGTWARLSDRAATLPRIMNRATPGP